MEKKLYVIEEKAYLRHIDDEVHLYGLLHQLAFLAGKVKDAEDMANLIDTVKRYGEIADEKFDDWDIPGRYCVFGDKADLMELYKKELQKLSEAFKAHDREKEEKEKAQCSWDTSYIIRGWSYRLLVGDMFRLLELYGSLMRKVDAAETEKDMTRLKKQLPGHERAIQRAFRRWGVPEDGFSAYDALKEAIEARHLIPIPPDEPDLDETEFFFPDVSEDE